MSVTVEHVSAVTRHCDSCGKEEMRTVLGTDPEFAAITWENGWKQFSIRTWMAQLPREPYDVCSKECYEKIAIAEYDKL